LVDFYDVLSLKVTLISLHDPPTYLGRFDYFVSTAVNSISAWLAFE